MPQRFSQGQGALPLDFQMLNRIGSGYGWIDGCGVRRGGSTSDIELVVDAGTVLHDGIPLDVSQQSVTLQNGDAQDPRKDLVWIDSEGTARTRAGIPAPADPSGRVADATIDPAPPSGSAIDGVPLREVWVPAGATETADLDDERYLVDRRVPAVQGSGSIRTRASDPPDSELIKTQWWRNTTANELRAFFADAGTDGEVHSIDTTFIRALGTPSELVIEDFEDSIVPNWRGGSSTFTYESTNAFEGTNAAYFGSDIIRKYSLVGDGLQRYPDPGDTISLAVRLETGDRAYVAFAKDTDSYDTEYRVVLSDDNGGELRLVDADGINGGPILDTQSLTVSDDTWYIIEVEYDGNGTGSHPFRVYSTSGGSRDTVLAENTTPPSDTQYRGRGVGVGGVGPLRIDRLGVTPG